MSNEYNGHKNWDYWNVYFWLSSEDPQSLAEFRVMEKMLARYADKWTAAEHIVEKLAKMDVTHTPDGVKYTVNRIFEAIK